MNQLFKHTLGAALAMIASLAMPFAALAQTVLVTPTPNAVNYTSTGITNGAANYTNSTTTASNIVSLTVPATRGPGTAGEIVEACFVGDAVKATATSGTVTFVVNGTPGAAYQIASTAGRSELSPCYWVARPTNGSFTVAVTGVSADTNTFTVYGSQLKVQTWFVLQGNK